MIARRRVRGLRAAGAHALREFSGRVAPAAVAACGRTSRRCMPLRGSPTISPTKAMRLSSGMRCSTTGRRACDAAVTPATRQPSSTVLERPWTRAAPAVFQAVAETIRDVRRCPSSLFEDLVSAFRQDVTVTAVRHVDRRCSTTAGDRRIRSAASSCESAGYRDGDTRRVVRRRLHGAAADEFLAGPGGRLAPGTSLRARAGVSSAPARVTAPGSRADDAGLARRTDGVRRRALASCSRGGALCATACRDGCAGSCAPRGSAASRILDRLETSRSSTSSAAVPSLRRRAICRCSPWRAVGVAAQ